MARAIAVALGGVLLAVGRLTDPEDLERGRLKACPRSPNCVSSQAEDPGHRVEPLAFEGDPAAAFARLERAVAAMSGAVVVSATDRYLHAEFTSRLLRFVDDVELLLDAQAGVIHVRSASRVGYSDLGANRKRVAAIREAFGRAPDR